MVPVVELAPISENVHAGKVFPVTDIDGRRGDAIEPPAG